MFSVARYASGKIDDVYYPVIKFTVIRFISLDPGVLIKNLGKTPGE